MKYQADDKVVIKPKGLIEEQGNMTGHSDIICHALEGTDRVVSFLRYGELGEGVCWVKLKNNQEFAIPESIILGHAFEYGEVIEVSRDGKKWFQEKFYQYRIGDAFYVYETPNEYFKFARPIRKPKLEAVPENIRFEFWRGENLVLGISNTQYLCYNEEYKNWFVTHAPFQSPVKTYLQPCNAKDLKVGDWFIANPEYKVNLKQYNLVTAINDRNISVCYTENGGIRLAGYSLLETYYKVVRGEE